MLRFIKNLLSTNLLLRWDYAWREKDLKRELALFWDTPLPAEKIKNTNTEQYEQLISVCGLGGWSGSSIISDFLLEFDDVSAIGGTIHRDKPNKNSDFECSFWHGDWYEEGSILSLEKAIFTEKIYFNFGALNFSRFVLKCFMGRIWIYDDYYLQRSKEFLFDLIECHWRWTKYAWLKDKEKEYHYTIPKKPKRIERLNPLYDEMIEVIWKKFTLEEFRAKAKQYMEDFLKHIPSKKFLVCDQLLHTGVFDAKMFEDYFGNIKMFYVWRDPRDQYAGARRRLRTYIPEDPIVFSKRFKKFINNFSNINHPNCMVLRLEDFCTNYDEVSKKIINFLGLNPDTHTRKFEFFDPKISTKKIGSYKNCPNQEAIKIIEKELKEYCWD